MAPTQPPPQDQGTELWLKWKAGNSISAFEFQGEDAATPSKVAENVGCAAATCCRAVAAPGCLQVVLCRMLLLLQLRTASALPLSRGALPATVSNSSLPTATAPVGAPPAAPLAALRAVPAAPPAALPAAHAQCSPCRMPAPALQAPAECWKARGGARPASQHQLMHPPGWASRACCTAPLPAPVRRVLQKWEPPQQLSSGCQQKKVAGGDLVLQLRVALLRAPLDSPAAAAQLRGLQGGSLKAPRV